jgi:peptide/nickel transport system substrate-binding protein
VQPASPKRVTIAMVGEPRTLNYTVEGSQPGGTATNAPTLLVNSRMADVYRGTVTGPMLATRIPTVENGQWVVGADGAMQMTWNLRQDVYWHDGTKFTANDLLFAAQLGQDKDIPALRDAAYANVSSLDAPDPYTLVSRWRQPYILADSFLGDLEPIPKHLLEAVYQQDKANVLSDPHFNTDFVGTGPYRLIKWDRGSSMTFAAFDQYALGRPRIDNLELKFILDAELILAGALAGTIDVTVGPRLSLDLGDQANHNWQDGQAVAQTTTWVALFPQFVDPIPAVLADVRFRKALMLGTNRPQLTDVLVYGLSPVPDNYLAPGDPLYKDTLSSAVRYPYDPVQAAQMIESLGYAKGVDGFYSSGGQRLSAEIRTTAGDDLKSKLLLSLADGWKQIGIEAPTVEIPRQLSDNLEYRVTRPAFELIRQPDDFTAGGLRRFKGSEAALPSNNYNGQNRTRYQNLELDSLIDRYVTTIAMSDRVELARQMVHILTDQLPIMGMIYSGESTFIANRLVNVTADRGTRNVHEWDVK